jgi:integrase
LPKLSAIKVKSAGPGRHADGEGLYLLVKESGARSWMLRVQVAGKRRDIGLGSVAQLTLAEAREKANGLRKLAKQGLDPIAERDQKPAEVPTFEAAARACHAELKAGWRNRKHSDSWLASLVTHVFPAIGKKRVDTINSLAVRDALAPIWLTVPETARRVLQRIGAVLDFAHIKGWRSDETSLRSVRKGLPRQPQSDNHFEAMPYQDVPTYMGRLALAPPTVGRDALQFTILNAVRSNETRFAVWTEINFDKATWTIPAARMKMNQTHVVPLTDASISILRRRWEGRESDKGLIFFSSPRKPISDMTMTKVLRDDGLVDATVHGFRSAFTDWAAETTSIPKEVVDKALAHKLPDKVEAAYRRTDFFERRRQLMAMWANYLAGDSKVVRLAASS